MVRNRDAVGRRDPPANVLSRACAQSGLTDVTVVGLDGLVPWTGCSFQDLCDSLPLITVGLANHVDSLNGMPPPYNQGITLRTHNEYRDLVGARQYDLETVAPQM